jgi:hypothetical protein
MVIPSDLAQRFFEVIEIPAVDWAVVDYVAVSDPNILRPIKGVCFEEMFRHIVSKYMPNAVLSPGPGDSDVDINLNKTRLQLKTMDKGSTAHNLTIGVALHKTHGREQRPHNLYKKSDPTFDFLLFLHPVDGIMIVPFAEIPEHGSWKGYLADPAHFDWNSKWRNSWELLGFPALAGRSLESRKIPPETQLPKLSAETFLEDWQIIETLCRPEYFRAAVMGLKGNIKEFWLIDFMKKQGYSITTPTESYPKYDCKVANNRGKTFKVQIKGTSKNMCDSSSEAIGVEVMGTHGQFPGRGYQKSFFDYLAVVISPEQIRSDYPVSKGIHFLFMPVSDLPIHYLVGKGIKSMESGFRNKKWNLPEYRYVLYPNVKLKTKYNKALKRVEVFPDISSYRMNSGFQVISSDSAFRHAGPYVLDEIPSEFR